MTLKEGDKIQCENKKSRYFKKMGTVKSQRPDYRDCYWVLFEGKKDAVPCKKEFLSLITLH